MLDELSTRWDESPLLQLMAPVFCVAWEAMMFSRLFFTGLAYDLVKVSSFWPVLLLMACGCMALFVRRRWPLPVVLSESVVIVVLSLLGVTSEVFPLALVATYYCAARAPWRESAAGSAAILAAQALACVLVLRTTASLTLARFLTVGMFSLFPIVLTIALGAISHLRFDRRVSRRAEADAELRRKEELERISRARDAALRRGRIAAELHDSVGHDLTAIIALSEGLGGTTGDETLDHAICVINDLARAGLTDTRKAVRALSGKGVGDDATDTGALHAWGDIDAVLDDARRLGIICALTETGRRPDDAPQADLAFSITRESVTNAIRHGRRAGGTRVGRIVISWDHASDGSVSITVRDDGEARTREPGHEGGTGIGRLRGRVELHGGTFSAGFMDGGGWTVCATIPAQKEGVMP